MITIIGTTEETDYIIEQLACGACEGCPGRAECRESREKDEPDDGQSCGEVIRRHIEIINREE